MAIDERTKVLLRGILGVIGAASLIGCATRVVDDGDSNSDGAEGETKVGDGDGDGDDGDGDETESSDDGVLWDVGHETGDGDGDPGICSGFVNAWEIPFEMPDDCDVDDDDWSWSHVCFHPPDGTTCADEPQPYECILDAYECGLITHGDKVSCGPYAIGEVCCYVVEGQCAVGRPFLVDGRARLAGLEVGHGWAEGPRPELGDLDLETRAALADFWQRCGVTEHASIASFARFTTQLLGLGAPAGLIAASVSAGADERRHALRCFSLAAAYSDSPARPGALAIDRCLADMDVVEIAVSLAREGCVAETVSLMLLIHAHDRARDPAVRACLAAMIDEEHEHVLLAWAALAWLCRRFGPRVRAAVHGALAEAERHVGFGPTTELPGDRERMREHGYLEVPERRAAALEALRSLVLPASSRLASDPTEARPA